MSSFGRFGNDEDHAMREFSICIKVRCVSMIRPSLLLFISSQAMYSKHRHVLVDFSCLGCTGRKSQPRLV